MFVVQIFDKAVDVLARLFFVGVQEEFVLSSKALIRAMNVSHLLPNPDIKKERDQSNPVLSKKKADIRANTQLMQRAKEVNQYDIKLYKLGKCNWISFETKPIVKV